jgi:predicted alpha/beta superfamily hydrolase
MDRALRVLALCLLTTLFVCPDLFSGTPGDGHSPKPFVMNGTHHVTIHSNIVGDDYDLYICFPKHYADTLKSFPVLYLIDGQYDFPLVDNMYYDQYYDGRVPDLIVVGITWAGQNRNIDSLRLRDYTPTTVAMAPQSGGAPKFLAFITKELVPYVEGHYKTDKHDRALMGSSLGGLFTLYAMFHETDFFTRYVLTSPSLQWDNFVTNRFEDEYHAKRSDLPVRLYMAIGGLEGIDEMFKGFVDRLHSRGYKGLQMQTAVLADMGHAGGKPEGYARGMQYVFERQFRTLSAAEMASLVGRYFVAAMPDNPQASGSVVLENGQLLLVAPGGVKLPLQSESENDFSVRGTYLFLKFSRDASGVVTGVRVDQFNASYELVKAKGN